MSQGVVSMQGKRKKLIKINEEVNDSVLCIRTYCINSQGVKLIQTFASFQVNHLPLQPMNRSSEDDYSQFLDVESHGSYSNECYNHFQREM